MEVSEARSAINEWLSSEKVSEHCVFLSFNNDEDGIGFREWWVDKGEALFLKWFQKNKGKD